MADITGMLQAAAGAGGAEETDANFNQTVLLLHGDGTNGEQNNTFLDSSTNNFTITRNGNTTQGTFSPFSTQAGGWSNYFDGSGDYLSMSDNAAFDFGAPSGNDNDFTIEAWIYLTGNASANNSGDRVAGVFSGYNGTSPYNGYEFQIRGDASTTGTSLRFNNYVSSTGYSTNGAVTISQNEWHHLVVVRYGTTYYFYVDGVRYTGTGTLDTEAVNASGSVRVGSGAEAGYLHYFPGYISNIRVTKNAALYTAASISVPTSPLTTIVSSGTVSYLSCQSNRFVDNSTNNFALTVNGNPKVTPFSPFAPTAAYDASVNGGSGYFDGSGDYLSLASNSAFAMGTGDFLSECWFYTSDITRLVVNSSQTLFNLGSEHLRVFLYSSTGNIGVVLAAGSAIDTGDAPKENQWNHLALCRSGTNFAVFLNGTRIYDDASNSANITNSSTNYIGAVNTVDGAWLGYIASTRFVKGSSVYDPTSTTLVIPTAPPTNITNTSLLLNFTNAGIFDNTGKNNLETVGNAQIDTTTKKYGTGSMEFDGTGDYLYQNFSNQDLTLGSGDWTIEMFVYLNSLPTSGNFFHLLDQRPAATNGTYPNLHIDSSGSIRWFINDLVVISSPSSSIGTGAFYHVAICKSAGSTKMFLDGTQVGSTYSDSNNYLNSRTTIGGSSFNLGAGGLDGYIDELRISRVARYTTTFTPPTKAFPDL